MATVPWAPGLNGHADPNGNGSHGSHGGHSGQNGSAAPATEAGPEPEPPAEPGAPPSWTPAEPNPARHRPGWSARPAHLR